jgi:hypothetical protein
MWEIRNDGRTYCQLKLQSEFYHYLYLKVYYYIGQLRIFYDQLFWNIGILWAPLKLVLQIL